MPKTQAQCAKIREETREKILSGALSYFAHYGYGNSTVGDLAKHLGIAQGALYRYFPSKAELFRVLTMEVVSENNNSIAQIFELPISVEEKIKNLTKTVLDGIFYNERTREGFVLNIRMKLENREVNQFSEEYDREADVLLEQTIKEGQGNNSIVSGEPSALSDFYWHSMHMIAVNLLRGKKLDYQEQYHMMIRILLPD